MMNGTYKVLTIEKSSRGKKPLFDIVDTNEGTIASFERIFDCAIVLRFLMGKTMSRCECDLASALLKDLDEKNQVNG